MPFTPDTLGSKPYNACVTCEHIGVRCDGPNFLAMTSDRWCEWVNLRRKHLGWSTAHVAELSGISKATVDRAMSASGKDLRISSMQEITRVVVNGSWGQYPCALGANDDPELEARCAQLQSQLDDAAARHSQDAEHSAAIIQQLQERVAFQEDQARAKDVLLTERADFLRRKDRAIGLLATMLTVAVLLVVTILIIDLANGDIGFFRF